MAKYKTCVFGIRFHPITGEPTLDSFFSFDPKLLKTAQVKQKLCGLESLSDEERKLVEVLRILPLRSRFGGIPLYIVDVPNGFDNRETMEAVVKATPPSEYTKKFRLVCI